ncbi:MAG: metallophosphoesterase, partial [Lachnospiraceae bacterium]|nr:metallophosphoesterase [Lachnospiraceae bacterium]
MKILAVSDSHNKEANLGKIFKYEEFDAVVFLGDVEYGGQKVRKLLEKKDPLCPIVFVLGNCDEEMGLSYPVKSVPSYDGIRFFLTHGHKYAVSQGREGLAKAALEEGASYALFGHLHVPILEEVMGVVCFNPGSVSEPRTEDHRPSYGLIVTENGKASFEHRYVDELPEDGKEPEEEKEQKAPETGREAGEREDRPAENLVKGLFTKIPGANG